MDYYFVCKYRLKDWMATPEEVETVRLTAAQTDQALRRLKNALRCLLLGWYPRAGKSYLAKLACLEQNLRTLLLAPTNELAQSASGAACAWRTTTP